MCDTLSGLWIPCTFIRARDQSSGLFGLGLSFNPASDWRYHFLGVGASERLCFTGHFHMHHFVSHLTATETIAAKQCRHYLQCQVLLPVTQDVDKFFLSFICFLLTTIYSQLAWWGCWGPSEYSLDRSQTNLRTHSNTAPPKHRHVKCD